MIMDEKFKDFKLDTFRSVLNNKKMKEKIENKFN